ncbi:MAG: UDP-N-acetylmuramoyl-tripeptide--D-alanyl-D-alanine ligase [Actinobacteria bacterium]|nr:UDP-N-acetylmuramoyl-tripeptide--D-alanyl-D-alanine ligase [Actinomycetota bacterium]
MENILISEILNWSKSKLLSGNENTLVSNFSTDTRIINKNDFFIPITGENYDGNDFIIEAIKKGAKGFVISKNYKNINYVINNVKINYPDILIIQCSNTLDFLKDTAKGYLKKFNVLSIGITGSVGKTTTKNFLVNILKNSANTVFTKKNFNNEIGIPKTIFDVNSKVKYFVAELGMRAKNQIMDLAEVCNLNSGIITGIGPSHLEFFNNIEEIALAKAEISEIIFKNKGVLFLNGDDYYADFIEKNIKCNSIKCGKEKNFEYNFSNYSCDNNAIYDFDLNRYYKKIFHIKLNIPGFHNIYNALLAISLALYLDIDPGLIKNAIEDTTAETLRMEIIEKKDNIILNDCYNANPLSMKSAIDALSTISQKRKMRSVAILGDMLELGNESKKLHEEIGKYLLNKGINVVIAFGENSANILNKFNADKVKTKKYYFKNKEELLKEISNIVKKDDAVLIKGSRANKMENIIDYI